MEHQTQANSKELPGESEINFKFIVGKALAFLPYVIISIVLSLCIAFLIVRYATPVYLVKTSMLIKDNSRGRSSMAGADNFLQGMQLLNVDRNIENEQGILMSKKLVRAAISQLDFGISYYSKGSVKRTELYADKPFIIELDSNHLQIQGTEVFIQFKNEHEVSVWTESTGNLLVPKTEQIIGSVGIIKPINHKINELISNEYYAFKIKLIEPNISNLTLGDYSFKLNLTEALVKQHHNSYALAPINKQASLIEIKKEGANPEKEKAFLNELCESYINLGLSEKNRVTQKTLHFIDEQLLGIGDSLVKVEGELQDYRKQNKIIDLGETGNLIIEELGSIEQELSQQKLQFKYYTYLENYVKGSDPLNELIAPSIMGVNDQVLNALVAKIIETYSQKQALGFSYQDESPNIKQVNQNLQQLKMSLLENLKSIKEASVIISNELNRRIAAFDGKISQLPAKEQEMLTMKRRYVLSDKLYTYLLEKRAEAGIAGAGIDADHKVVDVAEVVSQTYPKVASIYSIALIIGLVFPIIIILIMEFFNYKIINHSQLQYLTQIPLVGSIVHNAKNTALVIANHPKAQVSESFRNLRSNLNYLKGNGKKQIIMVTSTVSGEGKTFIGMNLSSVLAIGGLKTVLIGVDLRKPKIFQDFKLDNSIGLTNYLIGKASQAQIIQKTGLENLDIITSGPVPPNPSELIMSQAFYDLLADLANKYDHIILDTPPIGLVADGLDIMKHADVVLYVSRQNVSKKSYLNLINEIYANENEKNIGLVFNDINFAAVYGYGYGAYGYGYGYSYGSGYGYGYSYGYGYGYGYGGYGDTEVEHKSRWKRLLGL
jgi:tyrosine-protein kinase Etk/Wzc